MQRISFSLETIPSSNEDQRNVCGNRWFRLLWPECSREQQKTLLGKNAGGTNKSLLGIDKNNNALVGNDNW